MLRRKLLTSVIAGALTASLGGGLAWADDDDDDGDVGPLVQATGLSPFGPLANCGDDPGFPAGTNFTNIEVEPWIVANPRNRKNLVAYWQQDRWSNGGARSNVAGVSFDRGETWEIVVVPDITECAGGDFDRASDPWLDFSPDGTLHQMSLVFDNATGPSPFGTQRNGMATSKSTDGGLTWSPLILLIDENDATALNDKNTMTADPQDSNLVYAVWDRLDVTPQEPLCATLGGFEGRTLLARTTNGGDSYLPATEIFDPGCVNQTIGNQIVVLPDGTLVNFFNEIINFLSIDPITPNPDPPFNLALIRSTDKGANWESTSTKIDFILSSSVNTPDTGEAVRDANIIFDVAVDPKNGTLYAVWQDSRFTGFDQIAYAVSKDGGDTWSPTVRINQTPATPANPLRQQAFIPSVEVTRSGAVAITYYDFRNDEDGTRELADHFMIICEDDDDCDDPDEFEEEIRLTNESFDYREAAQTGGGLFLGDYVGLEASRSDFLTFFQQSFPVKDADGFFRRVNEEAEGADDDDDDDDDGQS
ncbi:MAG: sialidase family protein [Alphaproteobacteria bacterium]|nr:sialidase family protein [Alphaproteobacteria bacterium]